MEDINITAAKNKDTGGSQQYRLNREIRASEVRLLDPNGDVMGIVPRDEALKLAQEADLDLVEIAPQADPPVCRIMDYSKFKFEQQKKQQAAKKKQKQIQVKEVKMRPTTEEADFQVKLRNAIRFLEEGDKVKLTIRFRGREIMHQSLGEKLLNKFKQTIEEQELGTVEQTAKVEGKQMTMILAPPKKKS